MITPPPIAFSLLDEIIRDLLSYISLIIENNQLHIMGQNKFLKVP